MAETVDQHQHHAHADKAVGNIKSRVKPVLPVKQQKINYMTMHHAVEHVTDGTAHAVVIVDADKHIAGLVTQTDLLAALSSLSAREGWGR